MQVTLQQVFDISRVLEIKAMPAQIIGKFFHEFDSMSSYYQVYQKAYNKIASKLINNNGGRNPNKHYKVFFKGLILKKVLKAYTLLVAIIDIE